MLNLQQTSSGVYLLKNLISGRVYIGSSSDLKERFADHLRQIRNGKHDNEILRKSALKHGATSFVIGVIEYTEDLKAREQYWMDHYKSYKRQNGFNILPAAYSRKGHKESLELRLRKSAATKGKPKTADHNRKNSEAKKGILNPNFGKPAHPALRAAVIASNKRRAEERKRNLNTFAV